MRIWIDYYGGRCDSAGNEADRILDKLMVRGQGTKQEVHKRSLALLIDGGKSEIGRTVSEAAV